MLRTSAWGSWWKCSNNDFSRRALEDTMARLGFETGVVHQEQRPEYSQAYRAANAGLPGQPALQQQPDVVALLAPEGTRRLQTTLAGMDPTGVVYLVDGLDGVETPARTVTFDFTPEARQHVRKSLSTLAVGRLVQALELYPLDALREAIRYTQRSDIAEQNVVAIDAIT